jgi:hypothetical protein
LLTWNDAFAFPQRVQPNFQRLPDPHVFVLKL